MKSDEAIEILNRISKREYLYLTDALLHDEAEVVYSGDDGLWILHTGGTAFGVSYCDASASLLASHHPVEYEYLHVQSLALQRELLNLGRKTYNMCHCYVMEEQIFLEDVHDFRPLGLEAAEQFRCYYHDLANEEYRHYILSSGRLWGLFVSDILVGFIGLHAEGAMGMLCVFPEERCKGYGTILESEMIAYLQRRGRVPFGDVIDGNDNSVRLQERLGLSRLSMPSIWMA